jgi:hypothetical protein
VFFQSDLLSSLLNTTGEVGGRGWNLSSGCRP